MIVLASCNILFLSAGWEIRVCCVRRESCVHLSEFSLSYTHRSKISTISNKQIISDPKSSHLKVRKTIYNSCTPK